MKREAERSYIRRILGEMDKKKGGDEGEEREEKEEKEKTERPSKAESLGKERSWSIGCGKSSLREKEKKKRKGERRGNL